MSADELPPAALDLITEQLEKVEQRLGALESGLTMAPATPSIWPSADRDLVEWVEDWLVPTFDMGVDVHNWQEIPALVSELSALWIGYRAMIDPKAGGFDPLVWHSHLASSRTRISEYTRRARHREAQLGFL